MSQQLSPGQILVVAKSLTEMQNTITDFKISKYKELNDYQKQEVDKALSVISDTASRLYAYAVVLEFNNVKAEVEELQAAAKQIDKILKTIANVQKAINIISSISALATAIMSHDIGGISNGLESLKDKIDET